ncbi:hypothetical protein D3C71_1739360 [compost metagenome]
MAGAIGTGELAQALMVIVVQPDLGSVRIDLPEHLPALIEAIFGALPERVDHAEQVAAFIMLECRTCPI